MGHRGPCGGWLAASELLHIRRDRLWPITPCHGQRGLRRAEHDRRRRLAWHENTSPETALSWTTRTISSTYPSPFHADVGDIDADGDPDVVASSLANGNRSVVWFENPAVSTKTSSATLRIWRYSSAS
jgi:hypothetical protein